MAVIGCLSLSGAGAQTPVSVSFDPRSEVARAGAFRVDVIVSGLGSLMVPSLMEVVEISLDLAADLNAAQPESFRLATLSFSCTAGAPSSRGLTGIVMVDDLGHLVPARGISGAIRPVPLPASGVLLAGAIVGVGWVGLRRGTATKDTA